MLVPSLNSLGFPDSTLAQLAAFASVNRVPYIEIRGLENTVDLLSLPDFSSPARVAQSRVMLQEARVRILSLNLGLQLAEDIRARSAEILQYADLAHQLGAAYLRFFSGGRPQESPDLARIALGGQQVLELLAPYPVQMLVETHDSLVHSADILELNQRLDGRLNILWDIAHPANFAGEAWEDTYARLKPLIRYLHVKDTRKEGEKINNVLLFEGELPVRPLLTYLARQPGATILSFEWEKMWQPDLLPGEIAARDFLAKLQAIAGS